MTESYLPISISILVFAVVITTIILGIRAFKEKDKNTQPMRLLWHAYLYIMTMLSLTLFLYGGMRFTRAMMAKYVAPYFSYQTSVYDPYKPEPIDGKESVPIDSIYDPIKNGDQKIVEFKGTKYTYDFGMYKSDVVDGLTMFISLAVLFGIHRLLVYRSDKEKDSFFKKVYNFVGLAQYGILTLIALPLGIYNVIRYFTEDLNLASYNRPIPGAALAMLIFVLPAWIVFLVRMAKENKQEKKSK